MGGQGRWGAACRELGKEVTREGWQVNALERNRLENTNIYCEEGKLEINKTRKDLRVITNRESQTFAMRMRSVQAGLGAGGVQRHFLETQSCSCNSFSKQMDSVSEPARSRMWQIRAGAWQLRWGWGGTLSKSQGRSRRHVPSLWQRTWALTWLQASNSSSAITSGLAEVPSSRSFAISPSLCMAQGPDVTKPVHSHFPLFPV